MAKPWRPSSKTCTTVSSRVRRTARADYVIGMTSALKMKPKEKDYHLVEEHLALYTVRKAMLWPGSLTWYDTSCTRRALGHTPRVERSRRGLPPQRASRGQTI